MMGPCFFSTHIFFATSSVSFSTSGVASLFPPFFVFNLACFVSLCVHSLCGSWALVAVVCLLYACCMPVVCLLYALCVLEPLSVMERG